MRVEPEWVETATVRQVHLQQLELFGGSSGIRDLGLLESALMRPRNLWHSGEPTLFEMAASYAYGLAKNHPFIDGNKRVAFVTSAIFLEINGYAFTADEVDATMVFLDLASGNLDEADLAIWFEANCTRTET